MNKEIELKPGEGNYYAAMTFHWVFVALCIVPVFSALVIAIINPLWFRDDMFRWIENGGEYNSDLEFMEVKVDGEGVVWLCN